jgi:hypothetical protein
MYLDVTDARLHKCQLQPDDVLHVLLAQYLRTGTHMARSRSLSGTLAGQGYSPPGMPANTLPCSCDLCMGLETRHGGVGRCAQGFVWHHVLQLAHTDNALALTSSSRGSNTGAK